MTVETLGSILTFLVQHPELSTCMRWTERRLEQAVESMRAC